MVPKTYAGLYTRAANAAVRALSCGVCGVEIEFPPTPALNRAGDGSLRAETAERESNARLAVVIAAHFSDNLATLIVFDRKMLNAVEAELMKNNVQAELMLWVDAKHLLHASQCDQLTGQEARPIIGVSPGALEEWEYLERLVRESRRKVIVANGLFHNGLDWLESVFYVKPCSGWGVLMKEYPHDYIAVSARTGTAINGLSVALLSQGRIRRPDLRTVSKALQSNYFQL